MSSLQIAIFLLPKISNIVSKVLSAGADFGNIRQIHFGNLWHNMSRIYQIIGRGSRFCSHSKLDKDNRNENLKDIEKIM